MTYVRAALALASGEVFYGRSFGAEGENFGEAVFNTSMAGYQEILTDPSYRGQLITMTYPEIGNYGVNEADFESGGIHASGFAVRHYSKVVSHHRATGTLGDLLKKHGVPGIEEIDTRRLTLILRHRGNQKAVISTKTLDGDRLVKLAQESPSIEHRDLVKEVTTAQPYDWPLPEGVTGRFRVAVYDFGVKWNILRHLASRGGIVRVFPAYTPHQEILQYNPHGVFLSNGPGDPSALPGIVANVQALIGKKPMFGICLGHQLIGQAYGATTYKLKFGHRGGNQPVLRGEDRRVEITSQNHGFAVNLQEAAAKGLGLSHANANDQTSEGLQIDRDQVMSVQYHPESAPGPHDSHYLFDRFFKMMEKNRT